MPVYGLGEIWMGGRMSAPLVRADTQLRNVLAGLNAWILVRALI